jgi:adenosylhomocysteine nucleosidase
MKNLNDKVQHSSSDFCQRQNNAHITLVCFAINEEAAPFKRIVRKNPTIRVVVTGIGQRNAERAISAALNQQAAAQVWTCGFAGGLDPELDAGTVVFEESSATIVGAALEKIGARRIRFMCSKRMIITSAEKLALREETGADAVEMESSYIQKLCRQRNIPCVTIRIILDTADETLPLDFNQIMTPDDRISYGRLGLIMIKSPDKVSRMLVLRKRTKTAAENLARALSELAR